MKKLLLISLTSLSLGLAAPVFAQSASQGTVIKGDAAAGKAKSTTCAACHGADGNSVSAQFPRLAGQNYDYLVKQLHDFKSGKRKNATMSAMAAPLSNTDIDDLAAYFSSQKVNGLKPGDKTKVAAGEAIYRGGDAASGVPACMACHGPDGMGNPAAHFPRLAGQHAEYIVTQLKAFHDGSRANDAGQMMRNIAVKMTDKQMDDVAQYIQGLRP
ncbi:MAG: c-type cytochrome [Gammaproteobacteria bacterium]|jgi:cytochrome c553